MEINQNRVDLLLIEDSTDDAEFIVRAFNLRTNLQILHLKDGVEGLDYLFGNGPYEGSSIDLPPRLILLDLNMPCITGFEVLEKLKSDPRTRPVPVVVLTSSGEDPDIARAYDLGASSYIVKGINASNFEATILKLQRYWFGEEEIAFP